MLEEEIKEFSFEIEEHREEEEDIESTIQFS